MKTKMRPECLKGISLLAALIFGAMNNPCWAAVPPIGDLSPIYGERDMPLQDASVYLGGQAANWTGCRTDGPDLSLLTAGPPLQISGAIATSEGAYAAIQGFVQSHLSGWGNLGQCELLPLNAWLHNDIWHVAMQQGYDAIPVFGSRLEAKLTSSGKLLALSVRFFPADQPQGVFALALKDAAAALAENSEAQADFGFQVYYPLINNGEIILRRAWQIRAITDQADQRPAGIVDAQSSDILLRYNDVANDGISGTITGLVLPSYWNDTPQAWPQKNQWVNVVGHGIVYTNSAGYYFMNGLIGGSYQVQGKLQGLYVDVNNDDGPDASYSGLAYTTSPLNWTWDYDLARQDEVNVYYHTDLVHHYYTTLDPDFTALDFPLPATVGYGDNYENAFWNGAGIYFGTGGMNFRNFALFCDVIYHEYGHGVTDNIYPDGMLPYSGQPGAMDEGWSDYFACSITDEPLIGEGGLQGSNQPLRNLDNNLRYPEDWGGEVHADGRIFGGSLWDLREMVGANVADTLAHFARYALAEMWEDYFLDVLILDDDDANLANGGPHHPEIYEAFGNHGIGPGLEPELQIFPTVVIENGLGGSQGNGDGFFDPGEILSMTFSVTDYRYLYPPPAEDVTVTVTTDDPDLTLSPESFALGDVAPGAIVQSPDSLLITIAPSADLNFSHLVFHITANGGSYQITDSIEIIVGHPATLLVDDDDGANYQQYLDASLRLYDQVFCTYDVDSLGPITLDDLNKFQVVIWMTGNDSVNTLTAADRANLAMYLNGGHNLLLTGQNLVEDIGSTTFFSNYLKAAPVAPDMNDYALDGVAGDPISDSSWVLILGGGAAGNQTSPAAIAALPGAVEIYHYQNSSTHPAGAVRYDSGTYKVVTFAFGCEAISGLGGSTTRPELLTSVLSWFGLPTAVEPEPTPNLPTDFIIGAFYPNPFNAQTSIKLTLPHEAIVKADIYNLRGQLVETLHDGLMSSGAQALYWNASKAASGVYFLNLNIQDSNRANLQQQIAKVLLLK